MKDSVQNLFKSIDNMDTEKFVSYLTEDSVFHMGNSEPVVGKENIFNAVDGFFKSIKGLSHSVEGVIETNERVVTPGKVTYTRHDDSTLTVKFCNVLDMDGELVKNYNVFIDLSELYQ